MEPKGSTSINKGVELALEIAGKNFIQGGNNRIILATDGQFELSRKTIKTIEKAADEDIKLSVFYFSGKDTNDKEGKKIAGKGKGYFSKITKQNIDKILLKEVQAIKK